MDRDERELLTETIAQVLAPSRGGEGDSPLAEVGWHDILASERGEAIAIVFAALGTGCVRASCLSDLVSTGLGRAATEPSVLPAFGSAEPPGTRTGAGVVADGIGLAGIDTADTVLVMCDTGEVVSIPTADLRIEPAAAGDPSLGLCRVRGTATPTATTSADWVTVVDDARLAIGHELNAAARTMLELACTHARDRVQFGRPVASFQAVRHKLAEVAVAVESADAALEAAHDSPSGLATTLARVLAGRAAATAGRHCQQVLAGIGFTREHEFHRFLLRTIAVDGLFGSTSSLTRALGADLLASGTVPRVIEL